MWLYVYGSFYLHLSKNDSDHVCYIYLASFTSPADFSPKSWYLVTLYYCSNLCKRLVQKFVWHGAHSRRKKFQLFCDTFKRAQSRTLRMILRILFKLLPEMSTATGLPTVITSIRDWGEGGDSNMKWDRDEGSCLTGSDGRPVLGSIQVVTWGKSYHSITLIIYQVNFIFLS